MKLTDARKSETGAFYTPPLFAKLAVEYMQKVIPNLQDFLVYDMAAGEGALLEALPPDVETYATTLERDDFDILRDKGFNCNQFNFLTGDVSKLMVLQQTQKPIIVFTNPPYFKIGANECLDLKKRFYNAPDASHYFLLKALYDIRPAFICAFTKTDVFTAPKCKEFRQFYPIYENARGNPFICPSEAFGCKGDFPIIFHITHFLA